MVDGQCLLISGALAGIAAIVIASIPTRFLPPSHGNFYELYGVAAAVLAAAPCAAAKARRRYPSGGGLAASPAKSGQPIGHSSSLNFAVMGAVILAGVTADQLLSKRDGPA